MWPIFKSLYRAVFTAHGRERLRRLSRTAAMHMRLAIGRGKFSYDLPGGQRFVVHGEDRLSHEIYIGGGYEPTEASILRRLLNHGDVMFDIGANIGFYAALGSRCVGADGRVYAFEPGPRTHDRLLTTLKELGRANVVPVRLALSDSEGEASFSSSLAGRDAQQGFCAHPGLSGDIEVVKVSTCRLDNFVETLADGDRERIKLIKCDVEGGELLVLRGAEALLARHDPPYWLIEFNRQALSAVSVNQADILSRFEGSTIFYIPLAWPPSPIGTPAQRLASSDAPLPDECNLLVVPPSRANDPAIRRLFELGILTDQLAATSRERR